ncbi:probable 28S ribosomal protein S26, mitochondrial [Teleopsis dalmanni]|uniref:probable 28S ribosomal protein S26, mitochondrial n=1 Tax=Teleopsis dalmanni TaxID=139649 RepID=UPI0018CF44BE|nr:probable 28S ribosomal protein S26, mitochondrial [Teleopsis dalmanni]XP_037935429.1 probable 28S ribosomal protein S26, mitochondrial [Teleopsis dalmanni]
MLRAGSNILTRLTISDVKCANSALSLEFVRWRRKPRWLPVAKSKMFKVPERPFEPPEEKAELKRLHNIYKTQLRSVRLYLREEVKRIQETSTADHYVLTPEEEEAEFQRCFEENEIWNKKIAEERNERLEKERAERVNLIKERIELAKIRHEERLERAEEIVRKEKENAKTFITLEKLDEAIEHALANPVDYNFSIDLNSNIYRGRTTVPGGSGTPATTSKLEQLEAVN